MQATLDHIVVHAGRGGMDAAAATASDLGFTLTERGYHSMGSINHLVMFQRDYLELLGVPANDTTSRPELHDAPLGLNGLVFKTDDADHTYHHLQAIGMDADPPKFFSRVVETQGGKRDARFRTVTVRSGVFTAGRVYFCEHQTPELVWRPDLPELKKHANGAGAFKEIVVVSDTPTEEAANFGLLLNCAVGLDNGVDIEGFRVQVLSWTEYGERFGKVALPRPVVVAGNLETSVGRCSIFGAVGVSCRRVSCRRGDKQPAQSGEVRCLEGFNTLVQFWPADASL
eukprot:SAG31_NODE_3398_length_4315_cov_1.326850_1_plen_285_part_00